MLSLVALLISITSVVLYWRTLKAGIYRRIPVEHYVLLGTAAGVGLYALLKEATWWAVVVFIIASLASTRVTNPLVSIIPSASIAFAIACFSRYVRLVLSKGGHVFRLTA